MRKISFIVPCYKVEKYLARCLDSLLEQTLDDIEIICVNDGSPDNSINILKNYQERYKDKISIIDKKMKVSGEQDMTVSKLLKENI